uniref:Uncharacterized protein n=1 Tax=Arundo donax TaxID=35708 RepID=A0A0A9BRE4_ARUDO
MAGPRVLAGFMDAPVDSAEMRAFIITAAPAPTAINSFTALGSVARAVMTKRRTNVVMNSMKHASVLPRVGTVAMVAPSLAGS